MKKHQIAAQLYTVREHCRDVGSLAASLARIREIGYAAVQVSGVGPIPAEEIRRLCDLNGLTICATHEPGAEILGQPERCVDRLRTLGCRLTAYPWPANIDFANAAMLAKLARDLDAAGAVFRSGGCQLGYHNHALELTRLGSTTVLEYFYSQTAPENLVAELDTYWIHCGGGDVVAWIERLRGRLPFIHLKDCAVPPNKNEPTFAEVGRGNLDWSRIVPAAEQAGCEWFIVEQDTCAGDPFESLRLSFEFLCSHHVQF